MKGEAFALYLKNLAFIPRTVPRRLRFLANRSDALMLAFLECEPGSRVHIVEPMTAVDNDFFIQAVSFDIEPAGLIWCEWGLAPIVAGDAGIWDTSVWDGTDGWVF